MDELAKRFAELAEKYDPNVIHTALEAARMEAYSNLVSNFFWLITGGIILLGARWFWQMKIEDDDYKGCARVFGVFLGCVAVIIIIASIANFADPWLWATLKNPELWIAKKVLKL